MKMELKEIQKEITRIKVEQDDKLELAIRKDEKMKTLKEIRHEIIMLEHRTDIKNSIYRWGELKEIISNRIKGESK